MISWLDAPTCDEFVWLCAAAKAHRVRTLLEFAEQEIVIPDGRYANLKFRAYRQPYQAAFFRAVDDGISTGRWNRYALTGCVQSGKTFCVLVVLMYFLFELQQNVVFGLPDMKMAGDKWRMDILPIIKASRFRDFLPKRGDGSRGGDVDLVIFGNGAAMKFMGGGGGDEQRSAFTARVLIVTEVDKMDEAGTASREADKVTQLEARIKSWGHNAFTFMECTRSIPEGKINQEIINGTDSHLYLPCHACGEHVLLGEEHLIGWQDADDEIAANEGAVFVCPECGAPWNDEQRILANQKMVMVHRGQSVGSNGVVTGEVPRTYTLGFQWNAVHNVMSWTNGDIGLHLWKRERTEDDKKENAKKESRQFWWAECYAPDAQDAVALTVDGVQMRKGREPRGIVPDGTVLLTAGMDVGKWRIHWVAKAWKEDGSSHVIDYAYEATEADKAAVDVAIAAAANKVLDRLMEGWEFKDGRMAPKAIFMDSRYQWDAMSRVAKLAKARGIPVLPTMGYGATQRRVYTTPLAKNKRVVSIGDGWHMVLNEAKGVYVVHVNSDNWKTKVQERLALPFDRSGSVLFFASPNKNEHRELAKHLTAEKGQIVYEPGKPPQLVFTNLTGKENHYLDCSALADCAADFVGVKVVHGLQRGEESGQAARPTIQTEQKQAPVAHQQAPMAQPVQAPISGGRFSAPGGRPFISTRR
jgi:phage terminase large subunit GpA-like protein